MKIALLRGEIRVMGWLLFAIPLVVALVCAVLTGMLFIGNVVHSFIVQFLVADLEALLPLVIGIIVANLAVQDAAIELQLSLPVPYRFTVFLRFALLLIWTMLVELAAELALQILVPWAMPKPFAQGILVWFAPTLLLAAIGIVLALLLRNRATCVGILGSLWVVQLAFHGFFLTNGWTQPWFLFVTTFSARASFWLTNRIELILLALIAFAIAWWYLYHPEWRFYGEEQ